MSRERWLKSRSVPSPEISLELEKRQSASLEPNSQDKRECDLLSVCKAAGWSRAYCSCSSAALVDKSLEVFPQELRQLKPLNSNSPGIDR